MSVTIFRRIGGRVVPMIVDEARISEYETSGYVQTPRHSVSRKMFDTLASFLIPNAHCQKCGSAVFYYENASGSRVLFDALGPPWPIHPCYNHISSANSKKNTTQPEGWKPVLIEKGVQTKNGGLRLQGIFEGIRIRFSFDESTFKRMKIMADECKNLIVFACEQNKKVQTNTGKQVFQTRYEIVTHQEPSDSSSKRPIHVYGSVEIASEKHIDVVVIENGIPVLRYSLNYDCYIKYFSGETVLSMKTSLSKDGQRIDSARSPSYGMYILLDKISDSIHPISNSANPPGDIETQSVSSSRDSKIFIRKISILTKNEETNSILFDCTYANTAGIYLIISDKQSISEFLLLREDNPRLVHNEIHTLERSGTKNRLVLDDGHMLTSLSFPVDHISKHIALELIRETPEYLAKISSKRARKAKKNQLENIKKDMIHPDTQIHLKKDIQIRFKKKRPLSLEVKIASVAQKLKTPMAEAFKNAKGSKKK